MRRLVGLLVLIALLSVASATRVDAKATTVLEKATTLHESFRVAERLRAAGFEVGMTRTDDRFVELPARSRAGRGADFFVSIHNNGHRSRSVVGSETYYQIGNRLGGEIAYEMVRTISARAGTVMRGAFTRKGDNGDYYHVLRETPTTAIIVEGAFLSNPGEARRLADPGFRVVIADAIADVLIARLQPREIAQGSGPPPARLGITPAPPGITAGYLGSRTVKVSWQPTSGAAGYDVWRDGHYIGQVAEPEFVDRGLAPGRHRYDVRSVANVLGVVHDSQTATTEAIVPIRVVVDPGHGGKDPGAVGRF